MSFFHIGRESAIPKNATFQLTPEGQERLMSYSGKPQARVLSALATQGTSDRDEIASTSGMSRSSAERHILALLQKGYIRRTGSAVSMGGGRMNSMEGD